MTCLGCSFGKFKGVNGSGMCSDCPAGTYLNVTGGSVCLSCPASTNAFSGSVDITDCICNIGYEGSDGGMCTACGVGTYKDVNGSGTCSDCEAGRYLNVTAGSVCFGCPPNTNSRVGSDEITDCICNI
eukprot:1508725-Rhodomonas_salina.1